jgi:enoyl-CoA hydratase/carnithine racemase
VSAEGAVCIVALARPEKRNALSMRLLDDLRKALQSSLVAQSGALVLTGSGGTFCAGADLGELRQPADRTVSGGRSFPASVHRELAMLEIPTVSAIEGYCLGGGLELALATDLRIADPSAVFGLPEISLGTLPSWGGIFELTRLVGAARAGELILLGEKVTAKQMADWGVVSRLAPEGESLAHALGFARYLSGLPPAAFAMCKRMIRLAAESSGETQQLLQILGERFLEPSCAPIVPDP